MRLPSRLQAKHVTRNFSLAEFARKCHGCLLSCARIHAVPESESPLRWHKTTTREDVIALHRIDHCRPGEQIYIHARSRRYFNLDAADFRVLNALRVIRIWICL